jgi:hypothetical protein
MLSFGFLVARRVVASRRRHASTDADPAEEVAPAGRTKITRNPEWEQLVDLKTHKKLTRARKVRFSLLRHSASINSFFTHIQPFNFVSSCLLHQMFRV